MSGYSPISRQTGKGGCRTRRVTPAIVEETNFAAPGSADLECIARQGGREWRTAARVDGKRFYICSTESSLRHA